MRLIMLHQTSIDVQRIESWYSKLFKGFHSRRPRFVCILRTSRLKSIVIISPDMPAAGIIEPGPKWSAFTILIRLSVQRVADDSDVFGTLNYIT